MLDKEGFDNWSGVYDEDILKKQENGYPFEGYYHTLGYIQKKVKADRAKDILDIGIGTGLLTETLYEAGMKITGVDFSSRMLDRAKTKMPQGRFLTFDLNNGLPKELEGESFDHIISSYAVHHIDDERKIELFNMLMQHLRHAGLMLIGDVAFETREDMERVKARSTGWDDSEYYMAAAEMIEELEKQHVISEFVKTSCCSGVLVIKAPSDQLNTEVLMRKTLSGKNPL